MLGFSVASMVELTALVLCGGGVALLWYGWRRKSGGAGKLVVCSAWVLLLLAAQLWSGAVGAEFGISYTLLAISLFGWALIAAGAEFRPQKAARTAMISDALAATSTAQKFLSFVFAGPLSGLATCLATVCLVRLIPLPIGAQMVSAAFLFPLAWGGLAVWVCAGSQRLNQVIVLAVLIVLPGLYLIGSSENLV